MIQLFQISFNTNSYEINSMYDNFTDDKKDKIYNTDVLSAFDFDYDDKYQCFLLVDELEIKSYLNILQSENISYICNNITFSVINNDFNIEEYIKQKIELLEYINYYMFISELEIWIYDNLNLDDILDRINNYGINTLREIDIKFLEEFQ